MGIAARYIKKIHEETTFYATWTPSQVLALGDFGTLDGDGAFVFQGKLKDLGFTTIDTVSEERPNDFLEITTESGTSITIKAAGNTLPGSKLPDASAGIAISFAKSNSLVCKLKGARQESIGNFKALQDFILQKYKEGKWSRDWRIVSQRIAAEGTTIAYSDTDNVDIEATAKGTITDIADASLGFSMVFKKGGTVSVLGAANLTPFVSLVRLHSPLFGSPGVKSFTPSMVASDEVTPVLLVERPGEGAA